jgi:hypothetical protein
MALHCRLGLYADHLGVGGQPTREEADPVEAMTCTTTVAGAWWWIPAALVRGAMAVRR